MELEQFKSAWEKAQRLPGGGWLAGKLIGIGVPYSGSIRPQVRQLESGLCQVAMNDRRSVRNHLKSVHAAALLNLGELSTGLAVLATIPPKMRFIITKLTAEYFKKARGTITATCRIDPISPGEESSLTAISELSDEQNNVVAKITAHWLIRPV